MRPDAVLATNTSALSVTEIAAATSTPERVVGMHFFNPAPLMPLVEIVRAELSSDNAVETAFRLGERLRVAPEDMDTALRSGAGWPMGPCTLLDLVGIDVHVHASEALYEKLREPRMAPPPRLVRMAQAGKLGRKSGEGFYRYDA